MGGRDLSAKISRSVDRARLEAVQKLSPAAQTLSREFLCRTYIDEERDICSIAREAGCRPGTVVFHLAAYGIPMRPPLERGIRPLGRRLGRKRPGGRAGERLVGELPPDDQPGRT